MDKTVDKLLVKSFGLMGHELALGEVCEIELTFEQHHK